MIPKYLKKKLVTIILPSLFVAILFIVAIFHIILPAFQNSLMESKKEMIRELTHMACDVLTFIEKQVESGQLTLEQGKALGIEEIKNLHYGIDGKDYFWINDMQPSMIMHPYRPDLDGQDLSKFTDPDGKHIFVSFVDTVRHRGSGYVKYMWQWKDDPELIVPKLSYVTFFKPWDWIIGTGVYLEDARLEFEKITNNLIYISGAILCALAFVWTYIVGHALQSAKAQQQAEKEVEHYRDNLKQLVDKRTSELAAANDMLRGEISDRKRTEVSLRESESRYRGLFELANDAIFIVQGDVCVSCNYKTLEMFGCNEMEQFVGRSPSYFSPKFQPDGRESQAKSPEKWNLVLQGKPQFFQWRYTRLDDTLFDADVSLNLIEVNGEKSVQAIVRDITLRKQREGELQRNEKLESLGILAGGIAHDFNNLLTVIMGNISLTKVTVDPNDAIYEKLIQSEKASLQAKELTQQLLTFSKGGSPIKKITSIEELITDSTIFSLRGSNIKYEYSFDADLWTVEVDEGQLCQVIQNLVINAYQAMPSGGTIKISVGNVIVGEDDELPLEPGKYIKISVRDQGKGIPHEHLPLIFDPYFTSKKQGSGLGLAVAYSVIQKHDGYITVDSWIEDGADFQIYLPASQKADNRHHQGSNPGLIIGTGKILIMDDEEFIREFVSSALKIMGYESEAVANGQDAIDLYVEAMDYETPFDAVIMDLTIPGGMGGKEVIQQLLEVDSEVKAIVASGYANDPIMANCRQYGFSGVITKPFDICELSIVLNEILH